MCAQKDWLEHRHKLCLFGRPPTQHVSEEAADAETADVAAPLTNSCGTGSLLKHGDVYYLQSPEKVHDILNVERYSERWPLIPLEELRASTVQHPEQPTWHWLLHTRRAPVQPTQLGAPSRPSAGVGDAAVGQHARSC